MRNNVITDIIKKSLEKKMLTYKKGDYLFHENEEAEGIYLLVSGKVKIIKNCKGDSNMILHIASGADVLGIHAVVNKHNHTYSATAITKTTVYLIPRIEFLNIVKQDIKFKLIVMRLLCSSIDMLENKMSSRIEKSAGERLAETLVTLSRTYGTDKNNYINFELSLQDLADMICTSREYANKIIYELSKKDLIASVSGKIQILNSKGLEQIAMKK